MYYYHATFFSNRNNIVRYGLRAWRNRIWGISRNDLVYLADSPEEAAKWMVYWYEYQLYELLTKKWGFSNTYWSDHTEEEIIKELQNVDKINEGIVVFEVNADRIKVIPRYDDYAPKRYWNTERGAVDYYVEGDIPPEKVRVAWQVSPEEIKSRVMMGWGME